MTTHSPREKTPRIHLASLGCAKNLVDSERILARLASAGAVVGAAAEEADVIIVNTCGFIAPAKAESVETILELAEYKKRGRCRLLLVMGCLAQRYGAELRAGMPEVDGVFGLGEDEAIARACGFGPKRQSDFGRLLLTPKHSAYLRIADGCDNRCAYCTIPMIRGPFRSRPMEEITREAEELAAFGVRELNLIGQDTTMYGTDLYGRPRIAELLARVASVRDVKWVRLLYEHPAHFSEELIEAFASIPKMCPYVDLPLQHLDDGILKRMGRRVTQAQCLDLIERIRERISGVAIRTTFIVGFPGETSGQFRELLQQVEKIRFDHLGAFAYSREEHTRAARMRGQVSKRAKAIRLGKLMRAQQDVVFGRNRGMIGRTVEVVIDRRAGDGKDRWVGRTRTQAPDVDSVTVVTGRGLRPGRFVNARIVGAEGYDLLARKKPAR